MRVILVGDELLSGRVRDANLSLIARGFAQLGISAKRAEVIPDDEDVIASAIARSLRDDGQVVLSGGLGPTDDDRTRQGLAKALSEELHFDEFLYSKIKERLYTLGHQELAIHRNYAFIPDGFLAIDNPIGIAPGLLWRDTENFVLALPGVPPEVAGILPGALEVLGDLVKEPIFIGTLAVAGMKEAEIAERLEVLPELAGRMAYYPRLVEVILKIRARDEMEMNRLVSMASERLGPAVYSTQDEGLESALGRFLRGQGLSVSTAESCTGGLIAHLITQVPGSSDYMRGGIVAYTPDVKSRVLDVPVDMIEKHSVYSHEVARAMAAGAARLFGSDVAISSSCVAGPGPDGDHPAGESYVGLYFTGESRAYRFRFGGTRDQVKMSVAKTGLDLARRRLLGL
ncbi:MAG: nicotinamide-nucleotide amidohydrolase family protein [candidate division WOR-3 bacterium]